MKLPHPENANYAAVVVEIKTLIDLPNCDNVVGTPLLGYQAIVSKDTKVGDLGIVFPPETQLSLKYATDNNLYRHSELNADPNAKGYLENNRRVKAMKFRGHRSDCLFMPLASLESFGIKPNDLTVGDIFDSIDGQEVCRKYVVRVKSQPRAEARSKERFVRVDKAFLPEHPDTDNYFRNVDTIDYETDIVVTQKLHGTSIRIGNTIVQRKLSWFERVLKRLGVKIQETEFDYVFGSRKVIKDVNNTNHNHFYSSDIWTLEGKKLEGVLPQNFIVYGELIGWTPDGASIQKNYTYQIPEGERRLYVYRVAVISSQGRMVDLSWNQVKEFCGHLGLHTVPELWRGRHGDFVVTAFIDKKFADYYPEALPLGKEAKVDEGVCIRVDYLTPYILKAKSPIFLQWETKTLDEGISDLESEAI